MKASSRGCWAAAIVILAGPWLAALSLAQDTRVPTVGEEESPTWRFTFTPQFWASGLSGRVGIGTSVSNADLSFGDVFGDFDITVMGLFEARRSPWVIRADLLYMSLADDQALATDGSGTLQINQEQFMLQPELGYSVLSRPWGGLDALVGARYWHLSIDLTSPSQVLSGDRGWVDGTAGASFRYQPAELWWLFAKADAGAGGSNFTWQGYGGAGYDLGRCCTLVGGYRYLDVDYESDDLTYDVHLDGPVIGVTLRF
jgi:Outer membrane protein beta-barrel domain